VGGGGGREAWAPQVDRWAVTRNARSAGTANLEMSIERSVRGERFVRVGTPRRTVRAGSRHFPIGRKLGKHHIRTGTYSVS
jgi:hypothetical protein